ncbi:MAG TPA: hypothetical protein DEO84_02880 [candidate division Zixibacteria bacterium]|nr:hypothetical protein [candidate division Zixibacteria bacterium]HBZ00244.1 hypothetical protein [candidate division Zixibacteria bacterium]
MQVRFCLKLKNAVIGTISVDYFEIKWLEELTGQQLAGRFQAWLNDETFIQRKLPDLKEAGFCQLLIDPL